MSDKRRQMTQAAKNLEIVRGAKKILENPRNFTRFALGRTGLIHGFWQPCDPLDHRCERVCGKGAFVKAAAAIMPNADEREIRFAAYEAIEYVNCLVKPHGRRELSATNDFQGRRAVVVTLRLAEEYMSGQGGLVA